MSGNWIEGLMKAVETSLAPFIIRAAKPASFTFKEAAGGGYENTVVFYLMIEGRELKVEVSPIA